MSRHVIDAEEVVRIIAAQLEVDARDRKVLKVLMSHGMDRKEAKWALQMARVGFELALSRSMGVFWIRSSRTSDPIVAAAIRYANARIGQEDCPKFLRRSTEIAKILLFLLLIALSILGVVALALYASDGLILYVGYLLLPIALLGFPLIFYLLWLYGVDKWP